MDGATQRALDPAERYFALLDQLLPMNSLVTATFSISIPPGAARAAWLRLSASMRALRSRIDFTDPLTPMLVGTDEVCEGSFAVCDLEMQAAMQLEQDTPFPPGSALARCRLGKPEGGPDYLLLTVDHSLSDGRGALGLLRSLIREIDCPGSVTPIQGLHAPLHERLPQEHQWAHRRSEMIDVLRTLSQERAAHEPAACTWHSRANGGRRIRLTSMPLSAEQTTALVSVARTAGTSVYGVLGATCLQQAHAAFDDGAETHELSLLSPVDLRRYFPDTREEDAVGMYTSMLTATYPVSDGPIEELSRDVASRAVMQLERGEGELFYALARCDRVPLSPGDSAWAARSLAAAPATVAVSNVGVIDDTGDPDWVSALSATLAPTSNQLVFVAATTYRGRVTINISLDAASMSSRNADAFSRFDVLRRLTD